VDKSELNELTHQVKMLEASNVVLHVKAILLDLEIAQVKTFPSPVDVEPYAQKIVAFLREHLVH